MVINTGFERRWSDDNCLNCPRGEPACPTKLLMLSVESYIKATRPNNKQITTKTYLKTSGFKNTRVFNRLEIRLIFLV